MGRIEPKISNRLRALDEEWDIERAIECNASALAFTGVAIAATSDDRRWLILPAMVTAFLFQHAIQGWCPPVPILRNFGFRTASEIEEERQALKALRGDYADVSTPDAAIKPPEHDFGYRYATLNCRMIYLEVRGNGRNTHHTRVLDVLRVVSLRHLQVTGDLFIVLLLMKYRAESAQSSPRLASPTTHFVTNQAAQQSKSIGVKFWTPIPWPTGSILQAE